MNKNNITYNQQKLIDLINRDKRTNIQIGTAVKQHPNMVGKIANGQSVPSVESLAKYAMLYGKDINYFYDLKPIEVKSQQDVVIIEGNDYILKRFEELVAENALLKKKVEEYESSNGTSYTLQNVPISKAAEPSPELKNK